MSSCVVVIMFYCLFRCSWKHFFLCLTSAAAQTATAKMDNPIFVMLPDLVWMQLEALGVCPFVCVPGLYLRVSFCSRWPIWGFYEWLSNSFNMKKKWFFCSFARFSFCFTVLFLLISPPKTISSIISVLFLVILCSFTSILLSNIVLFLQRTFNFLTKKTSCFFLSFPPGDGKGWVLLSGHVFFQCSPTSYSHIPVCTKHLGAAPNHYRAYSE